MLKFRPTPTDSQLFDALSAGKTYREIRQEFKVGCRRLQQVADVMGIGRTELAAREQLARDVKIIAAVGKGFSITSTAKKLHIDPKTVRRALDRYNLDRPEVVRKQMSSRPDRQFKLYNARAQGPTSLVMDLTLDPNPRESDLPTAPDFDLPQLGGGRRRLLVFRGRVEPV